MINMELPTLGPIKDPDINNLELFFLSLSPRTTKTSVLSGPDYDDGSRQKRRESDDVTVAVLPTVLASAYRQK